MLTRTLPEKEIPQVSPLKEIEETVDERGFYLYEWITPDELKMSIQADYLWIVKKASIPLAVVTFLAGLFGLALGPIGVILAILAVLGIFYGCVFLFLILSMMRKSYLYARGADVIITDNHYISGGEVIAKNDFKEQKDAFQSMEDHFKEPLFQKSGLKEYIALERKGLLDQLKDIAYGGGKIIENLGRSREAGGIAMVVIAAGALYGIMMAAVYFIGVFFVAIAAKIFSMIAHRMLLATNNLEHTVQTYFAEISEASIDLKEEKKNTVSLLGDAQANAWMENLSGKLEDSFTLINKKARLSTEKSLELKKLLESSKYKDLFNFIKYSSWIKKQILEPLEEIAKLLQKNHTNLEKTLEGLDGEIEKTEKSEFKKPLILQKERLILQKASFERMMKMIDSYKEKLTLNPH